MNECSGCEMQKLINQKVLQPIDVHPLLEHTCKNVFEKPMPLNWKDLDGKSGIILVRENLVYFVCEEVIYLIEELK